MRIRELIEGKDILIVARHDDYCKEDFTGTVIRLNHHCKRCPTDIRVIGGDSRFQMTDPTDYHFVINMAAAWSLPLGIIRLSQVTGYVLLADGKGKEAKSSLFLGDDNQTEVGSYDYIPTTGLLAIELCLFFNAKRIYVAGMNMFEGHETIGMHYLPPQRERFNQLLQEGIITRWNTKPSQLEN